MSLNNQSDKFDLPEDIVYLNTAYMSPLLKEVAHVGRKAVSQKSLPFEVFPNDFFEPVTKLKQQYAELIDCDEPERISIIPSVSYGLANVTNNISLNEGDEIVVLEEQFPSNIYGWQRLATNSGAILTIIKKPSIEHDIGKTWNENILHAITDKTAVIAMCHTHWADGTLFNLKAIREKSNSVNALLIIDGTQSVGALPFSIKEIKPDALICAGYKWLLGPYSIGLAYYGPVFDGGIPIEESWSNRLQSENFSGLTHYEPNYKPFANRYNIGEQANFIAIPMLTAAIKQLIDWQPKQIQDYCKLITQDELLPLLKTGCHIESEEYRSYHLFGIKLPSTIPLDVLKTEFEKRRIFVSIRGKYIRIAIHLFNKKEDINALVNCICSVYHSQVTSVKSSNYLEKDH